MALDMTLDLMSATVQLEQPQADGKRTVATGFLISDPTPDGQPRVVLVTANHVFARMASDQATIGYRIQGPDGTWSYAPQKIAIRADGKPLWTHHAARDVAVSPAAVSAIAIAPSRLPGQYRSASREKPHRRCLGL